MLLLEPEGSRLEIWWYDVKCWFARKSMPCENRLMNYIDKKRKKRETKRKLKIVEKKHAWFNANREPAIEQQNKDILLQVLRHLDYKDVLTCRLVCQALNEVISKNINIDLGLFVRSHSRNPFTNCITATTGNSPYHFTSKCETLPSLRLRQARDHLSAYQITFESGACDRTMLETLEYPICRNIKVVNWKAGFTGGHNRKRFFDTRVLQKSVAVLRIAEGSVATMEELVGFVGGPNMLTCLEVDYGGMPSFQLPDLIVELFTLGEKLQEFRFSSRYHNFDTTTGLITQLFQVFINQYTRTGEIRLPPMNYKLFYALKKYLNSQFAFGIEETIAKTFTVNLIHDRSIIVTNENHALVMSCFHV
ncbi:hypothetical protein L596_000685 [Steinernema carpocapsae]|uniref:F-box domain-containing protein n=1 Tax=Steinernema carpocapsae TaxID=34508 RepID=A0A4U8UJN2_STECR|nr:hypothetical protein L596_000685 [Steinernema carpocapsae]